MKPALYVHIPFCKEKCPYCDFYSITCYNGLVSDYIEALVSQIRAIDAEIYSIYIGGGTPTVLSYELWNKLLISLGRFIKNGVEFTVEVNPESLKGDILKLFLEAGVNRLSIGAQSFRNEKLMALGRIHNAQAVRDALFLAADTGFKNISMDLIFAVWGENINDWKEELEEAVSFPASHISVYGLTYEKDTPLGKALEKGLITPLEDEAAAEMYGYTIGYLEKEGFKRYEVSNFAKEGYACRHNQNYWENNAYLGLGASAVSYIDGVRKENVSEVREYIARHTKGKDLGVFQEKLSAIEKAKETAALKIRTREGIELGWFKQKTGFDFPELENSALARLTGTGLISYNRCRSQLSRIHLTQKGFLFADIVSSELL